MKLGIGTAQFGLPYGISNTIGQTPVEEVKKIFAFAEQAQIQVLDTASHYGTSEATIGEALSPQQSFKIVTKCPFIAPEKIGAAEITLLETAFQESQKRLKSPIYGLLIHQAADLLKPGSDMLWKFLSKLQFSGAVKKIGVSIYTGEQIDQILSRYPIELIQLPLNVFDQRLLKSGHIQKLKKHGVEIHARSIFLQGLLLMKPDELPSGMRAATPYLEKFRASILSKNGSLVAAALQFVHSIAEIDSVICGVNNCEQLREIHAALTSPSISIDYSQYSVTDESLVDPSKWSRI